jgi:hypothetical protein
MTIKAIIFDIGKLLLSNWKTYIFFNKNIQGGVCVGSPMAGIHRFEKEKEFPRNYLNVAM